MVAFFPVAEPIGSVSGIQSVFENNDKVSEGHNMVVELADIHHNTVPPSESLWTLDIQPGLEGSKWYFDFRVGYSSDNSDEPQLVLALVDLAPIQDWSLRFYGSSRLRSSTASNDDIVIW